MINHNNKKRIRNFIIFFIIGIIYYMIVRQTGYAIPCMFRKITGLKCPGCGVTTMCMCIGRHDFKGAYNANQFLFVTGPLLLLDLIYLTLRTNRKNKFVKVNHFLEILYMVALMIFGVARNLI